MLGISGGIGTISPNIPVSRGRVKRGWYPESVLGHDPSACLVKDGKIMAAAEEERFVKVKHAHGYFPYNAIVYCLREAGISIEQVDRIAYSFDPSLWNRRLIRHFLSQLRNPTKFIETLFRSRKIASVIRQWNEVASLDEYLSKYFVEAKRIADRIVFVEHHIAHASSAFRASGFDKASIISVDSQGEFVSTLLAHGRSKEIIKLREISTPHSLGKLYSAFTEFLGFIPGNGEGKVMGLAGYGNPIYDFSDIITVLHGDFKLNPKYIERYVSLSDFRYTRQLVEKLGSPRDYGGQIETRHKDIATSLQKNLEKAALALAEYLSQVVPTKNFCLAGGVALNCCMNSAVLNSPYCDDIFIQPAASDAGSALGAALEVYALEKGRTNLKMDHVYLGPGFTEDQIKETLDRGKLNYEICGDAPGLCGELLAEGKIIGWFQGRMEFGPRALGNRSILADPRNPKMKDTLNYFVKHRESFRPFAPSLLSEATNEYLEDAYPSPFMILTFKVRDKKRKEIPAVTHVDGTCRPQTVERRINPRYWRLIRSFEDETSIPLVLNTSFNIRGEPIVCNPSDAVRTFFQTGIDYLFLGDFLLKKDQH